MSQLAVVGAICATLLLGSGAPSSVRDTLIFISDIHMNVDNDSYSWMVDHTDELAEFLAKINQREDVSELIILGDLVDDWVAPLGTTPQTFEDVLTADNNAGIVAALQDVSSNPDILVTYVVGNHDMLLFEPENIAILGTTFPEMVIASEAPGLGSYSKDEVIWAEHGHRYCLFNAPDTWSRVDGHLPMGYFISRLVASKSASDGVVTTTPDVLDEFVKAPEATNGMFDDVLISLVFDGIALWNGSGLEDKFTMDEKDGYGPDNDPSVGEISITYDAIFSDWPSNQNRVSNVEAVWNDVGFLSNAANLLFEMPEHLKDKYLFTPRIILFGHTHQAEFQHHFDTPDTLYVNTGTWIDSNPMMTWAEIEIGDTPENGKTYGVSLWSYGETTPWQTATITVPGI
jgi:UDP-2,3-diacylglucosamine pyrophosphatase LpxH